MSTGFNKAIVIGNCGKNVELRYTQAGAPVCSFSVAVNEKRKVSDTWKESTEWITIVTFDDVALQAAATIKKGSQVFAEGRLRTRSYRDKDGQEQWKTEVVADTVEALS